MNETDELVDVTIDGKTIRSTPSHPFYSAQKGWTSAINLRAGDILVLNNGEYVVVEQIQHELLESPIKVYNFEVEDFHTYYVSANVDSDEFVLVHNSCSGVSRKDLDKAAGDLGYSKVRGQTSHGQPIYYNNRANKSVRYITPDADAHNGGFWKAANSIKNLASKATRTGTFTKNMIWLKD